MECVELGFRHLCEITTKNNIIFLMMKKVLIIIDFDSRIDESRKQVMVNEEYTVGMLMYRIRNKWLQDIEHTEAVFILFKDVPHNNGYLLQPVSKTLMQIRKDFGDTTTLNVFVQLENTFG